VGLVGTGVVEALAFRERPADFGREGEGDRDGEEVLGTGDSERE
jgi:hypothetical protein